MEPGIERPPHLAKIDSAFRRAAYRPGQRIIIAVPPRHGKSQTCSHFGPAWFLSQFPDRRVILCSYAAEFASTWGRKARDTFNAARAAGLSEHRVRPDVAGASLWEVEGRGGGMLTAGVGGGITGFGADLLVCDDLLKNAEEAASHTIREKTWDWLQSTARTRLEPGGSIILIATRWHHDDPTGRILSREAGEWEVINFPALAEEDDALGRAEGEALWPERYPVPVLEETKKALGSYYFAALYQQRPSPREGGMFKRHWFEIVDAAPADGKRVRRWDFGGTEGAGDFTCGLRMLRSDSGVYYVEDVYRDQLSPGGVHAIVRQTAAVDGSACAIWIPQDPAQAGKDQAQSFIRELSDYNIHAQRETGSKEVRAFGVAAQAEAGNVKLVRGTWNEAFLDEVCTFPTGANDDQVDTLAGASTALNSVPNTYAFLDEMYPDAEDDTAAPDSEEPA